MAILWMGTPPHRAILPGVGPSWWRLYGYYRHSKKSMSTGHQAPVNQAQINQAQVNQSSVSQSASHWSTSHRAKFHQSTRHRSTRHRSSDTRHQAPVTGHPDTGHWKVITRHQLPGIGHFITRYQSLVMGHQPTYQAPVSSIHAIGSKYRVTNQTILGSEHSFSNEPQNPTTAKRVLFALEPDFSNMSDPRILIEPPSNTWRSDNRQTSQTRHSSRRDQTKRKHKSRKRRHRSSSSSSSSRSSSSDSRKRNMKSKRSEQSLKRRRR